MTELPLDEFDYALPPERIAQQPLARRDASRLLVDTGDTIEHHHTADLPRFLRPGDVVVVNDTRVRPARVRFTRATGGSGEVLLLAPVVPERLDGRWEALVRPSRKLPPGTVVRVDDDLVVTFGDDLGEGRRIVTVDSPDLDATLARLGEVPLPPYVTERLADPERYQTVYARRVASAAAPTAGLHLTAEVLDRCRAAGATIATVELEVGLGTFRPIATDDVTRHAMHAERYVVPPEAQRAVEAASRVVAIGTTAVRALESWSATGRPTGSTDLFIRRGHAFGVVDVLFTNFHLPKSSLLVLLDAFMGPRWRACYESALAEGYRFLSFGDAMLVPRLGTTLR